jgi:hypothetical protein
MDNNKQTGSPKKFSGIRFGFGLFNKAPEPATVDQDQEIFLRRLEEVLNPESARTSYAPEPPRSSAALALDAAQLAAPVFASAPVMEPVPVMELESASGVGENAERSTELNAWPESEWRNIVQTVRAGAAFAAEPMTAA